MNTTSHLLLLASLVKWTDDATSGLSLPTDERSLLATGCFDVALEHQAAICLLHKTELHGSALALLRVEVESNTRGLWIAYCATDQQLHLFKAGKLDKKYGDLLDAIENNTGMNPSILTGFKTKAWNALNGFTHTGFNQVLRRHAPGRLGGNYPVKQIAQSCAIAGAFGLLTAAQLAHMADAPELLDRIIDRSKQFMGEMAAG